MQSLRTFCFLNRILHKYVLLGVSPHPWPGRGLPIHPCANRSCPGNVGSQPLNPNPALVTQLFLCSLFRGRCREKWGSGWRPVMESGSWRGLRDPQWRWGTGENPLTAFTPPLLLTLGIGLERTSQPPAPPPKYSPLKLNPTDNKRSATPSPWTSGRQPDPGSLFT